MNEIYELKVKINEIEKQIRNCTDENNKKALKEEKKNLNCSLASHCIDEINRYTGDIENYTVLGRREVFAKIQNYYNAFDKRSIPLQSQISFNWDGFLKAYDWYIFEEIEYRLTLKIHYTTNGIKDYESLFNREEISQLSRHLKDAIKYSEKYIGYEGYLKSFKDNIKNIFRLEAERDCEEKKYSKAIGKLESILKNPENTEPYWRSCVYCQKGEIYRTLGMYDFAIKEYEQAADVFLFEPKESSKPEQMKYIEERKKALYATLTE